MKTFNLNIRDDDKSRKTAEYIKEKLLKGGMEISDTPDYVIVVGGDGTFLKSVHKYIDIIDKTALIGVHTGTLGFLNDYRSEEVDEFINDILNKEPVISSYRLLECNCDKGTFYSVNEMRLENNFRTQILDVYADDEYVETTRGTGVCLSGQLGSTAYNRALDGAIIQNGLELLQLCEVTGIHNSVYKSLKSPIIFKPDTRILLSSEEFEHATLMYDHLCESVSDIRELIITLSDKRLRVARFRPYNYNEHLRKLY